MGEGPAARAADIRQPGQAPPKAAGLECARGVPQRAQRPSSTEGMLVNGALGGIQGSRKKGLADSVEGRWYSFQYLLQMLELCLDFC